MEEGTIVEWLRQPGERVTEGESLARVETDKIEVDMEAPASGVLAAHLVEAGKTAAVGQPIVVIAADERDYQEYLSTQP
jgi:pyruvate/2-oxoglutarate dehydrogenase complex dihydrolipoamide acyltransferase (E2) component